MSSQCGKPVTKRGVLSTNSSIYDPLGFASPFVLKAKAIFQELCRMKSRLGRGVTGGHSSAMAQMVERFASVVSTDNSKMP